MILFFYSAQEEGINKIRCLPGHLPPGLLDIDIQDYPKRFKLCSLRLENVIQPISDWLRNKDWDLSPDQKLTEEGKAFQEFMRVNLKTSEGKLYQELLDVDLDPPLPRHQDFDTASPETQRAIALKIVRSQEQKRNALIDLVIEHLGRTSGFGNPAFRSWTSPAIQAAATDAFDEAARELKFFQLRDTPSCLCEDGDEHRLVEIERVAKGICAKRDKREEKK